MKPNILILFAFVAVTLRGSEVIVRVVDDDAKPLSGASALVGFAMVSSDRDDEHKGITVCVRRNTSLTSHNDDSSDAAR